MNRDMSDTVTRPVGRRQRSLTDNGSAHVPDALAVGLAEALAASQQGSQDSDINIALYNLRCRALSLYRPEIL